MIPATCGPLITPPNMAPRPSGSRQNSVMKKNDAGCRKEETREVAMLAAMRQPEKKTRCNREETE